ncbi:hypothetical protein F5884DRAFT_799572 [Xylogone sp. PMI_703]|nr:hypothetical protein F5884DRAFT_799572 [Xylogone sp. PMI_703]
MFSFREYNEISECKPTWRPSVDNEENEDDYDEYARNPNHIPTRRKPLRASTYIIAAMAVVCIIGLLAWRMAKHKAGSKPISRTRPQWAPCGDTPVEARLAGCHYEQMQRSWIPDACYFPEPASEYDPFTDRDWFLDINLTLPLLPADIEKLRLGDAITAYTKYFHDEHCLYAWRKLSLVVHKRLPFIDTKSWDLAHSTHCAKVISKKLVAAEQSSWDPKTAGHTESPLMFQGCVPLYWADIDFTVPEAHKGGKRDNI